MTTAAIVPATFAATKLFSLGSTPKSIEEWEKTKSNMTDEDWKKQDEMATKIIEQLIQEEKEAIVSLTESLCELCMSDKVMCPVNRDVTLCPCDVIEKANYEYYNGSD